MNDDYKGAYLKAVADVAFLTSRIYQLEQELLAAQAQQESNMYWCGTCEQNVERGCGDSACQYRYKLPPAPEGDKE